MLCISSIIVLMRSSRKAFLVLAILTLFCWARPAQAIAITTTKTDVFNTPPHTDSQPRFDMGDLTSKDVIKIRLDFPDIFGAIKTFKLRLLKKSDGSPLSTQPAPFDRDISGIFGGLYQTFWTVPADGSYLLEVTSTEIYPTSLLYWYYLTIWNANSGTAILKDVDILRPSTVIYHFIDEGVGFSPTLTHTGGADKISVFSLDNNLVVDSELTPTTVTTTEATFALAINLNYIAAFTITQGTTSTYSYLSFKPVCLFHFSYSDPRGVFTPCTSTTTPTGFPTLTAPSIPIYGDTILQTAHEADTKPYFYTGHLTTSDALTITIEFPQPTQQDMPVQFILAIVDSNSNPASLPSPFNQVITLFPFEKESFSNQIPWTVESDGIWKIIINKFDSFDPKAFVMYNLKVEKVDGTVLLQETDILRQRHLYHHITLDTPSLVTIGSTLGYDTFQFFKMSDEVGQYFLIDQPLTALSSSYRSRQTRTYSVPSGNYGVRFSYLIQPGSTYYQSNDNQCPVTSPSTDVRRVFHPCSTTNIVPPFVSPATQETGLFASPPLSDAYPMFSLGSRAAKDVVNIRLDFPDLVTGAEPLTFQLNLLDLNGDPLPIQPVPMGMDITLTATFYETFWTVPVAGEYFIEVTATDPFAGGDALQWYYFTAWLPKTATPILKAIDMLRGRTHLFRYVQLGTTYAYQSLSHSGGSDKADLFFMNSGSQFQLDDLQLKHSSTNLISSRYTITAVGFYLARFQVTPGTSTDISYLTETYDCPYHSDYTDLRNLFPSCTAATPVNTFAIPAATGNIFGDSLLQVLNKEDAQPIYDLGSFTGGETVTIALDFQRFISLIPPNSLKLTLLDADNNNQPVSPQPVPFGVDITVNPYRKTTETLTWNVLAGGGNYKMQVERIEAGDPKGMVIYDLSVDSGTTNLVKETDILRGDFLYHLIHISSDSTVVTARSTLGANNIELYSMDSSSPSSPLVFSSPFTALITAPGTDLKEYTLNTGFYGLRFAYSISPGSTSYQSEQYDCPTTSGYADSRGIFRPCSGSSDPFINPGDASASDTGLFVTDPHTDSLPRFTLSSLFKGDIINIRLDFPDLVASTNPKTFDMKLLSSSGSELPIQPLPMGTSLTIDQSTKAYQTFWTVPADGSYLLQIASTDPAVSEALQWYYLTVWNAKDGTPLVRQIDMLRSLDYIYRYLQITANTLVISHTGGNTKSSLFSMDSSSQFSLNALQTPDVFSTSNIYTISAGYYLAKYKITQGTSADIGYQSKPYPCPYHSDYSDPRGIFKPCTAAMPTNIFTIPSPPSIPIFGDSLLQLADQSDARPIHDLGTLNQGQVIEISMGFPKPTEKTPTSFILTLLDKDSNAIIPQPSPFGSTLSIDSGLEDSWTVGETKHYKVRVDQGGSSFPTSFVIYNLLVMASGGPVILQQSDLLRGNNLFHLIHLSSQDDLTLANTLGSSNIDLYRMEPSNSLHLILSPETPTSSDPIQKVYSSLAAGFYGVSFGYDPMGQAGSAFYQSNSYPCLNTQDYTDIRGAFKPCTEQVQPVQVGKVNLHLQQALMAHKCIGRTYSFGGSCHPVSVTCNTFDHRSGRCTTCAVIGHKVQTNGLCGPPASSTKSCQGASCLSDKCARANPDGSCARCKSILDQVKSDGSCGTKTCPPSQNLDKTTGKCLPKNDCPQGQFKVGDWCYFLPDKCVSLNSFAFCDQCQEKYKPLAGNCQLCKGPNPDFPCTTCPHRHFVGKKGNCLPVDPECASFDEGTGRCFTCFSGVNAVNGVCCPSGQVVSGSTCVVLGGAVNLRVNGRDEEPVSFFESAFFAFCKTADAQSQFCIDCKPGHSFRSGTNLCA